jgi:Flp pilus assembly protein TadD
VSGRQNNFLAQALQQASVALRTQQFAAAEKIANEILKSNRTDRNAVLILAHALLRQDRAGEAVAPLERVIRRGGDAELETLLGASLCRDGRTGEGIEQLRRTAARRPPYLPAFQELAGQLSKAGQLDDAISTVEEGLSLVPGSTELKVDLGRLFLETNERAKARAVLTAARSAAPGRPDILVELGRTYILDGDYNAAADAFRQVLALHPDDGAARAHLATCLLEQAERDAGEAALRAVTRGRPHLLGRAAFVLAASSHGRFFFEIDTAAKYLGAEKP